MNNIAYSGKETMKKRVTSYLYPEKVYLPAVSIYLTEKNNKDITVIAEIAYNMLKRMDNVDNDIILKTIAKSIDEYGADIKDLRNFSEEELVSWKITREAKINEKNSLSHQNKHR